MPKRFALEPKGSRRSAPLSENHRLPKTEALRSEHRINIRFFRCRWAKRFVLETRKNWKHFHRPKRFVKTAGTGGGTLPEGSASSQSFYWGWKSVCWD